ncbi:MAG: hypothetical protein ACT4O0_08090 [Pseudonocardia sp.]
MIRKRMRELLTDPEHGVPTQLAPLITAYDEIDNPDSVRDWLSRGRKSVVLLRELAARAHHQPITHELLDDYPHGEALRRVRELLDFTKILPARTEPLERTELWLDTLLAGQPPQHSRIVRPFVIWHLLRRARRRATRRPINVAKIRAQTHLVLQFLAWLDEQNKTLGTADQADLDTWLDAGTSHHRRLGNFLTWARARRLCADLRVPTRPRGEPTQFIPDTDRWSQLTRCLRDDDLPLNVRAAGALVLLYGRTLTDIVTLTAADLHHTDEDTYLRFAEGSVPLPPTLASLFTTLRQSGIRGTALHDIDPQARLLFPGRFSGRPASVTALSEKLNRHGIRLEPTRNTARSAWANDIPAPIAADLLGLQVATAARWAAFTRRDWPDYLAARAQHLQRTPSTPIPDRASEG